MQTGERKSGPATCRVRQTNAVPKAMQDGIRELACLHTPAAEQGKGHATTLVRKVCKEADASNIVLMIWPKPYGDDQAMNTEQLAQWYERFGFQQIQPEPPLMARMPGSTPRLLQPTDITKAIYQ